MSGKLMGLCYNLAITRSQREVLLCFADHASEASGICWPSVPLIAWKTDISDRQVQRLIRQLEELEILRVFENAQGGRSLTPTYQINLKILLGLERPDLQKKPLQRGLKGDVIVSPFQDADTIVSGDGTAVPPDGPKGDIPRTKGDMMNVKGDISALKGDVIVSPEPSVETVKEPSAKNRQQQQQHHHHRSGVGDGDCKGEGEGKNSASLRSAGASSPRSEDADTQALTTKKRVEEAKRRFHQFRNSGSRTLMMMIDLALGRDEQARAQFAEWVQQERDRVEQRVNPGESKNTQGDPQETGDGDNETKTLTTAA